MRLKAEIKAHTDAKSLNKSQDRCHSLKQKPTHICQAPKQKPRHKALAFKIHFALFIEKTSS